MEFLLPVIEAVDRSPLYIALLVFFGTYPILMAGVWVVMSLSQHLRRERPQRGTPTSGEDYTPFVSVIIPAYAEAETLQRTLEAAVAMDYPRFEVIVVADGSPDATADVARAFIDAHERARPFADDGAPDVTVRLVDKEANEGKAMALNDGIQVAGGEILVTIDSDIMATPPMLRAMVAHFQWPRVGAVTGNPRVVNRGSLLRNLQTLEFASIVSVQRRAQRIWGRVLTVSGAVAAYRKSALVETEMFSPDMATEDIDITWKLQRTFWDVRYEASAVAWMEVPPSLGELWKQRRRWATGLGQVLRKHRAIPLRWKLRRMWPVFWEACASILWAHTFVFVIVFWSLAHFAGYQPIGSSPIPNLWGMMIATACLVQLFTGAWLDRREDPELQRIAPVAIVYPVVYWMLMSTITVSYTLAGFFGRRPDVQRWHIQRAGAS
jgi:poly-beta-1,6-N-acetyl-D-glucosamine synthase